MCDYLETNKRSLLLTNTLNILLEFTVLDIYNYLKVLKILSNKLSTYKGDNNY